jgi:hypothetical protein
MRVAVTSLFLAWAAFWAYFMIASAIGEGREGHGWAVHMPQLAVLAALGLAVWKKPRSGGVALAIVGALAMAAFPNAYARGLLAAPMLAFGAYYAWLGWKERRR